MYAYEEDLEERFPEHSATTLFEANKRTLLVGGLIIGALGLVAYIAKDLLVTTALQNVKSTLKP